MKFIRVPCWQICILNCITWNQFLVKSHEKSFIPRNIENLKNQTAKLSNFHIQLRNRRLLTYHCLTLMGVRDSWISKEMWAATISLWYERTPSSLRKVLTRIGGRVSDWKWVIRGKWVTCKLRLGRCKRTNVQAQRPTTLYGLWNSTNRMWLWSLFSSSPTVPSFIISSLKNSKFRPIVLSSYRLSPYQSAVSRAAVQWLYCTFSTSALQHFTLRLVNYEVLT